MAYEEIKFGEKRRSVGVEFLRLGSGRRFGAGDRQIGTGSCRFRAVSFEFANRSSGDDSCASVSSDFYYLKTDIEKPPVLSSEGFLEDSLCLLLRYG